MASTSSSPQPPKDRVHLPQPLPDSQSLPLATLVALLATMLGVSVLSSYDAEARWLRFGMLLFAVGLAMWLPYGWAALSVAALSLATAYARGGLTDAGVLRPETILEVPGVALTAALAALLRRQMEAVLSARPLESPSGETSAVLEERDAGPPVLSEGNMPAAAGEPALPRSRDGVRGVRLARTEESWAFVSRAKTAMEALELELRKTQMGLGDMRARQRAG